MRLNLVTPHEQGLVTLDQVQQQPFIGDPLLHARKGIGHRDVERHLAQAKPAAIEPGHLGHHRQADILGGLNADDQPVGLGRRPGSGKDRMRDAPELDDDLGCALRQPLAGAQIKGHALPAPIVDMRLQGNKGLGGGWLAQFLVIARHRNPVDRPGPVLPGHAVTLAKEPQRAQHLHLLVAHRRCIEARWGLHRHQRQQLEHVVLDHVAQRPRAIVKPDPPLKPDRLGHRDLDMLDMGRVPQRLEQYIGKAQRQQVLDRLLAQIMVDPEYPLLGKGRRDCVVDLAAGRKIGPQRLFKPDPRPCSGKPGLRQTRNRRLEQRRRGRQENRQTILHRSGLFSQRTKPFRVRRIKRLVTQTRQQCRDRTLALGRQIPLQSLPRKRPETGIVMRRSRRPDNPQIV